MPYQPEDYDDDYEAFLKDYGGDVVAAEAMIDGIYENITRRDTPIVSWYRNLIGMGFLPDPNERVFLVEIVNSKGEKFVSAPLTIDEANCFVTLYAKYFLSFRWSSESLFYRVLTQGNQGFAFYDNGKISHIHFYFTKGK
jgi:hypothetical protein